ncbi:MAG: ABC transporter permease [Pseudomonadales bacterium]|nr:ABC transporter permease [Pseudomonadales bacterium]
MKRLINVHPQPALRIGLTLIPFVLALIAYVVASDIRLQENPNDKLLPGLTAIGDAIDRMAFQESKRTGTILFWDDTLASMQRIAIGISLSALLGLVVGIGNGLVPLIRANLSSFVAILSLIPPMAILPVLFIVFGLGELSKVMLIIFGTAPFIMRDMQQRVLELPPEQLIKAQTLQANTWQIICRVVLPQVLPRLIEAVRLSLGAAWLFLIAAEAIASTEGLGYRIFLVRRYLAMDVILPYVAWITILAFMFDLSLKQLSQWLFPWYHKK